MSDGAATAASTDAAAPRPVTHVAAAVLLRQGPAGTEFLLARRPEGKVYAGWWEFPGGKVERGETDAQCLVRELQEEMAITVTAATPWITRRFEYPHASVRLKFFKVTAWEGGAADGDIHAVEHDAVAWTPLGAPTAVAPVLPANGPILEALGLPEVYAVTNAGARGVAAELARLDAALAGGLRLVQVREKDGALDAAARRDFAAAVVARVHAAGGRVLVNDDVQLARSVGADGVHLSSSALRAAAARPDMPLVAASCHDAAELDAAIALGCQFAVLGPVAPTASHPGTAPLGWARFAELVAESPIPVYGLGGLSAADLPAARAANAHGVAALGGW